MEVRPITDGMVDRYSSAWRDIEVSFLDSAGDAVTRADELVSRLLHDRGYRLDGSTSFPPRVGAWARSYAAVQPIARLNARGQATMRERREAMARYRRLLAELLRMEAPANAGGP